MSVLVISSHRIYKNFSLEITNMVLHLLNFFFICLNLVKISYSLVVNRFVFCFLPSFFLLSLSLIQLQCFKYKFYLSILFLSISLSYYLFPSLSYLDFMLKVSIHMPASLTYFLIESSSNESYILNC